MGAATGTTGTPGCATPPSRSTPCCGSVSPMRPPHFMDFIAARCHDLNPDGSLPILYGIDGRTDSSRSSSIISRGTAVRARFGSATTPSASSSSTSTASSWTPSTCTTSTAHPSPTTSGSRCVVWSTGSATTGNARTMASGRRAAADGTGSIRSSCAGSPSTGPCAWPTSARSRPTAIAG